MEGETRLQTMKINGPEAKQINSQDDILKTLLIITSKQMLRPTCLDRVEGSKNYAFCGRGWGDEI